MKEKFQYNFERLKCWEEILKLIEIVYKFSKRLPEEEKFGLVSQLKRAVTSIGLNLAEGSASKNKKIFACYLENSIRSLYEVIGILKISKRLFNLEIRKEIDQCNLVHKLLQGLLKKIKH